MNAKVIERIREVVPAERVLTDPNDLMCYSYDSSFYSQMHRHKPEAVIIPRTPEEIAGVIKLANEYGFAVVPRGGGSGQTGGSIPVKGGVVIDMSAMKSIVEIDTPNLQVIVEPGIVHADLNERLAEHGFFFPPDPGSSKMATIGGMVANNSSGMRAVKYGTTKQYVLGLEVVMPTGEVVWTGGKTSRALKNVSGYDLTQLLVGSEGTLGIITKIRLKVLPIPQKRGLVLAAFDSLENTGQAVIEVFKNRLMPSAIEILDRSGIEAALKYKPDMSLPEAEALLLFEVDGSPDDVVYQAKNINDVCKDLAVHVEWTDDPVKRKQLWQARQVIGAAATRIKEGVSRVYDGEDICIPVTRVPEALKAIQAISLEFGLPIVTYGHIGDGNMHSAIMANMSDPGEIEKAIEVARRIHRLAIDLGGSTTGEHGIGISRQQYMEEEHGFALEVMRRIKRALDPNNVLNPGKMALDGEVSGDV